MWEYIVAAIVVVLVIVIIIIWVSSTPSSPSPQGASKETEVMAKFNTLEEGSYSYCYFLHMLLLARREGEDVAPLKQHITDASRQMSQALGHYYILGEQYLNYFKEKADLVDRQMVHFVKCTHNRSEETCQAQTLEQKTLNEKIIRLFSHVEREAQSELLQALSAFDIAFAEAIIAVNRRNLTHSVNHSRKALDCLKLMNATLFEHLDTTTQ